MKTSVLVALIAGFPPTLAAILGYLANSRSLRRAVGEPAIPLSAVVDRLEVKLDHVDRNVTGIGERIARLEGAGDSTRAEHRFQSLFRELREATERLTRLEPLKPRPPRWREESH